MRRIAIRILLSAVILIAIAAAATPENSTFTFGTIRHSCAPWDGGAIALQLTSEGSSCDAKAPYLTIVVYDLPIQAGKTYRMGGKPTPQMGQVLRCTAAPGSKPGACQGADSGELVFDKFEENKTANGHYRLHFRDGELEGNFQLKWCEGAKFCG